MCKLTVQFSAHDCFWPLQSDTFHLDSDRYTSIRRNVKDVNGKIRKYVYVMLLRPACYAEMRVVVTRGDTTLL